MAISPDFPNSGRLVAAIFHDADSFRAAITELVSADFDPAQVSILAPHEAVRDHFGGQVPTADVLADRSDTPRESLDNQTAVHRFFNLIGETVAAIGLFGAAAAAYAVGGPVGVAIGVGADADATVEGTLERYVESGSVARYRESLEAGGLVLWVEVHAVEDEDRAAVLLKQVGGKQVHSVDN